MKDWVGELVVFIFGGEDPANYYYSSYYDAPSISSLDQTIIDHCVSFRSIDLPTSTTAHPPDVALNMKSPKLTFWALLSDLY